MTLCSAALSIVGAAIIVPLALIALRLIILGVIVPWLAGPDGL